MNDKQLERNATKGQRMSAMRCFVYRNLNRKGVVYSIKALEGTHKGKVIGYAEQVAMYNCEFVVSEKGRQRALRQGKRNVHAGIRGQVNTVWKYTPRYPGVRTFPIHYHDLRLNRVHDYPAGRETMTVRYNPQKRGAFITKHNKRIDTANYVYILEKEVFYH